MTTMLGHAVALARAGVAVAARRLRGARPLRPTWSWWHETIAVMLQADARRVRRLPILELRADREASSPWSPVFLQVERRRVNAGGVAAEWVTPRDAAPGRTIIYFHGGAYLFGSGGGTHRELVARIALKSGARVLAVDYRLAPEHAFPAPLEDAARVWEWLLEEGTKPADVVVAGDSSGGGLTVALLVGLRDAGRPLPAGAALLCPWVDLEAGHASIVKNEAYDFGDRETILSWARAYLAGADPRDPRASPIHADLRGLPPLLVQVGSAECLHDEVAAFATRARAAGVQVTYELWDDMVHDWHVLAAILPEARRAIDRVGFFVQRVTRTRAVSAGSSAPSRGIASSAPGTP